MIEQSDIVGTKNLKNGHAGMWIRDGSWWCSCGELGGPDSEFEERLKQIESWEKIIIAESSWKVGPDK